MKYCPKCKKIYDNTIDKCDCGIKLVENVKLNDNDPVYLISAYGFEKSRISSALIDYDIPYEEKAERKQLSGEIITGCNNTLVNFYIPFKYIDKARDIIIGIGALKDVTTEENFYNEEDKKSKDEFEEMNPNKRMVVKIISFVLFLLLIWGTVAGTDYIMALLKEIFK